MMQSILAPNQNQNSLLTPVFTLLKSSFGLFIEHHPVAFYSIRMKPLLLARITCDYIDVMLSYRYDEQRQMAMYTENNETKVIGFCTLFFVSYVRQYHDWAIKRHRIHIHHTTPHHTTPHHTIHTHTHALRSCVYKLRNMDRKVDGHDDLQNIILLDNVSPV